MKFYNPGDKTFETDFIKGDSHHTKSTQKVHKMATFEKFRGAKVMVLLC